jgi:cobalt-precorrin 5A hydrolase
MAGMEGSSPPCRLPTQTRLVASAAAKALGLPLVFLSQSALAAAAPRCKTRSERVEGIIGLPSLAEAAAVAGAGLDSRLVLERISRSGATCAIATLAEEEP